MQPLQYYKFSGLAEPTREAMNWLATRLRWERTLDKLRTDGSDEGEARQAA